MAKSIGVATFISVLIIAGAAGAQGMLLMAIEFLRNDSQARVTFIDKIAAPVANKMFECGMFP